MSDVLPALYQELYDTFGPQCWWPGETPFEVMVGAILTQGTNWRNVEKAIGNLKRADALNPEAIARMRRGRLAKLIRPSGYPNVKAARLKSLVGWFMRRFNGSVGRMSSFRTDELRRELLEVKGVGPETADSILLYAAGRPVFVVDTYTRRIFSRHGFFAAGAPHEKIRSFFQSALPEDARLFNEYHALLVKLGKEFCRTRPNCAECPVRSTFEGFRRPADD